jgi:SAM-dependent methyltransferase
MNRPQAFDSLAVTYDRMFTDTIIGQYLRGQVQARLDQHFQAGTHVLELGCGTGADALYLAEKGVRVTATDVSEGMLALARAKVAGNPLVQVKRLDLRQLPHPSPLLRDGALFDGVFSNFGSLNCLDDWKPLAAWLAEQVKPGGTAAFGVMSPLCLWEPLWHGLHFDFRTATRRWRTNTHFQPAGVSEPIRVCYPTIQRISSDFASAFRRVSVRGIGLFLPPSDVFGMIEKRPRLLKMLMSLETRWAKHSRLALFADHYWIEFERLKMS